MPDLFAPRILLADGWARDVRLCLDDAGYITAIEPGREPGAADRLPGPVVPGMVNAHSHAFQRLIAGLTDIRANAEDSFWTWREAMYRTALALQPEDMAAVCRHVYIEMLRAGYTTVAEFHYVHHQPCGTPYDNRAELAEQALAAASSAGIGLCLLPVLYSHGGFGGQPPSRGQRRFINGTDDYLALYADAARAAERTPNAASGIAFHSLRAVTPAQIATVIDAVGTDAPVHIHVAEQQQEVDDCLAWSGRRPVAWLAEQAWLDPRWCLVHATHIDAAERDALAGAGATVCLCPTTEANLGDGIAPAAELAHHGVPLAVGSDSHASLSVAEELRWLEYGQRLASGRRNRLVPATGGAVGDHLHAMAAAAGGRVTGQRVGRIAVGERADLVVLDADDPLVADCPDAHRINRWLFAAGDRAVRDVWVAGQRVIAAGHHADERDAAADFRAVCRRRVYA